jgi:hypothetical protein
MTATIEQPQHHNNKAATAEASNFARHAIDGVNLVLASPFNINSESE